jgi:hypothetical protein
MRSAFPSSAATTTAAMNMPLTKESNCTAFLALISVLSGTYKIVNSSVAVTETNTEPETETNTKPETETNTEPETKTNTEPETEANPEPETETNTEPETETSVSGSLLVSVSGSVFVSVSSSVLVSVSGSVFVSVSGSVLVSVSGSVFVSVSGSDELTILYVPDNTEISVRKAVQLLSLYGGQGHIHCSCRSGCTTGKCKCKRKNILCNSRCHVDVQYPISHFIFCFCFGVITYLFVYPVLTKDRIAL